MNKYLVTVRHVVEQTSLVEASSQEAAETRIENPRNWGLPVSPPEGIIGSIEIVCSKEV